MAKPLGVLASPWDRLMHEEDKALFNSLISTLEAIRAELRETQRDTGDHRTKLALHDDKLASLDRQIVAFEDRLLKLVDSWTESRVKGAEVKGGDKVKFAFLGAIGMILAAAAVGGVGWLLARALES